MTLVTPSRWLAACARRSSLFRDKPVDVIPNGLPADKFKPLNKRVARRALNLPLRSHLILFGANNPTNPLKGYEFLDAALQDMTTVDPAHEVAVAIFGGRKDQCEPPWPFATHWLGYLHDIPSLVLAYSAADVMVVPSRQEAFGQTASESMACGTPVVAFDSTGLKDIVDHQQNGYLAEAFVPEDLAHGIEWVLEDEERRRGLSRNAREKAVREFSQELQADRYLGLYEDILDRRDHALSKPE